MRFIAGYVIVIQTLSFTLLTFYPGTIKCFSLVAVMAQYLGYKAEGRHISELGIAHKGGRTL